MKIGVGNISLAKIIVCALLLLCTWMSWQFASKVSDYDTISLRYNTPISPTQADQARRHAVKTKSPFFPTYWSQVNAECSSTLATTRSALLTVWGDSRLVVNAPLLRGTYPAISQPGICAISDSMAWRLWGSKDVLGLPIEIDSKSYIVCGIFIEKTDVTIVGAGDTDTLSWQAVELNGNVKDGRKAEATAFAISSGLGLADNYVDNRIVAWLSRFAALLPLVVLSLVTAACCTGKMLHLLARWRKAAVFLLLLALAALLPMILELLPEAMLPTRWSDLGFWGRLTQALADDLKNYLMRRPMFIDGKMQIWLLSQAGLAMVQTSLLTLICIKNNP